MRRRKFIVLIGGTALAYPHSLYAQPTVEQRRRIGVLMGLSETDPATIRGRQAVVKELQKLGWTEALNIDFIIL